MSQSPKFRSHMLREIFEQPDAVLHTVLAMHSADAGYSGFDGVGRVAAALPDVKRIVIAASGTSRHAGIAGKEMLESMTTIPVEVDYASEFQHSPAVTGPETLVMVITQSGETADTLGSLRKAKASGATVMAVANVSDSSIMREADARIETKAGKELAIPSTKAFTGQLAALFLFSLWMGEQSGTVSRGQARSSVALRGWKDTSHSQRDSRGRLPRPEPRYSRGLSSVPQGRASNPQRSRGPSTTYRDQRQ